MTQTQSKAVRDLQFSPPRSHVKQEKTLVGLDNASSSDVGSFKIELSVSDISLLSTNQFVYLKLKPNCT